MVSPGQNQIYTIDNITYETLVILKNKLMFGNRCLRNQDNTFGVEGAKQGDTLRVRLPPRYVSTSGPAPAIQGAQESYAILQANNQYNVMVNFTSKDLALSWDNVVQNLLTPVAVQLASDIDYQGGQAAALGYSVNNSNYFAANYAGSYAGFTGLATPGGYPGPTGQVAWTGAILNSAASGNVSPQANAAQVFINARAQLMYQASPSEDIFVVLGPLAMGATAGAMFTNFNPTGEISEIYRTGLVGVFNGARFYESPNIPTFTSGTWTNNANVAVSSNNGDTWLNVSRTGANANIVAGDQFVVAGVYDINPLNRQSTGYLKVFTVTTAVQASAAGVANCQIFPPLLYTSSNTQNNQYAVCSALPTSGANVYWQGTSNTSTQVGLMYNKNALLLAFAPLSTDMPGTEISMARDEDISIRYMRQAQASVDLKVERFDVLFGWATVRPTLGVRLQA